MTKTKIEWSQEVWNPVTGCTKVSEGCRHCYAERLAPRVFAGQTWPIPDGSDSPGSRMRRFTDVLMHADRLDAPLRWRKPRRVFVNSMSDLFHEDVLDEFIDQVFAVMASARRHTFQVLTKRPQRVRDYFSGPGWDRRSAPLPEGHGIAQWQNPLPNVWMGVSCENQEAADERIPILLDTPAAVRFVSAEPLLGPIDVTGGLYVCDGDCSMSEQPHPERPLDWIIVGGESGPKARACDVAWIRAIVAQCKAAGVACFVKQLGARIVTKPAGGDSKDSRYRSTGWLDAPNGLAHHAGHLHTNDKKGGDPDEWPEDLRVREFPA